MYNGDYDGVPDGWGSQHATPVPQYAQEVQYNAQQPQYDPQQAQQQAQGPQQPVNHPQHAGQHALDPSDPAYQQYLVQALVNLGARTNAYDERASQQLDVLQSLGARLQEQAEQNAELYDKLLHLQNAQYANLSNSNSSFPPSAAGSGAPRGSIKIPEPRKFNGKADQVVPFLTELDTALYLQRDNFRSERDKSMYLVSWLADGAPKSWYEFIKATNMALFDDFARFVAEFKRRFQDPDLPRKYMNLLEKLEQTGSASSYANLFLEYLSFLSWTDEHLKMIRFDKGLKPELQRELLLVRRPATLHEWIPTVIDTDNKLFSLESQLKERAKAKSSYHDKQGRNDQSRVPRQFVPTQNTSAQSAPAPASHDIPMEVDAIQHGPLTPELRDHLRKHNLCFYCRVGKHHVRDCPNKKTGSSKVPASSGKA